MGEGVAREMGETSHHGVYAMVGGPHLESVAEVNMLRALGADVVGEMMLAVIVFHQCNHIRDEYCTRGPGSNPR